MISHHSPTSKATRMPLILCSITFSITGFGPLLMTVRALAWVTDRTVAALSHGTPNIAPRPPMPTSTSRSKWKPEPLTIFLSGLLTIRLQSGATQKKKRKKSQGIVYVLNLWLTLVTSNTTYVVIWDSRKIRIKTSKAGTQQANIIHTGKVWCSPKGLISQPRLSGLDTIRPLGTTNFWRGNVREVLQNQRIDLEIIDDK